MAPSTVKMKTDNAKSGTCLVPFFQTTSAKNSTLFIYATYIVLPVFREKGLLVGLEK
jgi:hypothetical protein